ncbi:MAG: hypothetical protein DRO99_04705 [Candidatus Aenigmatarchaeota archaeon]|nr:MAG: hypothetical protein DRO99_04705 [Candidatus Aenigmarchaeota archaeon]
MPRGIGGIRLHKHIDYRKSVMSIATQQELLTHVTEGDKASDVLSVMLKKGRRRLPVLSKRSYFRGMITTTDMLDFLGAGPKSAEFRKGNKGLNTPVEKVMETWIHALDMNQHIGKAIEFMRNQRVGGLPVLHRKKLVGFVSERDIINNMKGRLRTSVSELMITKPFTIKEKYPIFDVAKMMVHGPYRRLPVVREGILVGIVTPYDLLKHFNSKRKLRDISKSREPVSKAMNPNVVYVKSRSSIKDAISIMKKHRVGGVPVVEGDEMDIVGILTERDIIDVLE